MQKGFAPIFFIVLTLLVSVGGFVVYQKFYPKKYTFDQMNPTIKNGSASWKTYTHSRYGYSIKTPADFSIVESANGNVNLEGKHEIVISVEENEEKVTLKYFADRFIGPGASNDYQIITIDGINGLKTPFGDSSIFVFLEKGSKVYEIYGDSSDPFNQILSTFKFTN